MQARIKILLVAFLLLTSAPSWSTEEEYSQDPPFSLTAMYGQASDTTFLRAVAFSTGEFWGLNLFGLAAGWDFWGFEDYFVLGVEAQLLKLSESSGHFQTNAAFVFRWQWFPWNKYVRTRLGFMHGFSAATRILEAERRDHANPAHFLYFMSVEWELGLPRWPRWALVYRIHHRSGVFGMISNVNGGSNYFCGGVKYKF